MRANETLLQIELYPFAWLTHALSHVLGNSLSARDPERTLSGLIDTSIYPSQL